jgi:pimeloyl-ACP methyl ester carboxylesterase
MVVKRQVLVLAAVGACGVVGAAAWLIFFQEDAAPQPADVLLHITPATFSISEGGTQHLTVVVTRGEDAFSTGVGWHVSCDGPEGEIIVENDTSTTDDNGTLTVTYQAPADVDRVQQDVRITATVRSQGATVSAHVDGVVFAVLHPTAVELSYSIDRVRAGETVTMQIQTLICRESWEPLDNVTVTLTGSVENVTAWTQTTVTDGQGCALIPFFWSNAPEPLNVSIEATICENLTGYEDYADSVARGNLIVEPERPGDFPVVPIHGWSGSISQSLLNFTWYDLTRKLEAHNFTVLDFDVSRPGIQWLTYKPQWFEEHHIPWIAARVCERIADALTLNGYPSDQTVDIVAHSMGGLIARFITEHPGADTDFWNKQWNGTGTPWYGDSDADIFLGPRQVDDLIAVGSPCHGVPPSISEKYLRTIIRYAYFPWWAGQTPDMIYGSPFLQAMGYDGTDLVDYYGVGGDIGIIFGGNPVDFDGDGNTHTSDGLVPSESPYLTGRPLLVLEGLPWPFGAEDHLSLIAVNEEVHGYILEHLLA